MAAPRRQMGSEPHLAVDTLRHFPVLLITPARADDRTEVGYLVEAVPASTGRSVDPADADPGPAGRAAVDTAKAHGIELEVVQLPEPIGLRFAATALAATAFLSGIGSGVNRRI